MDDPKDGENTTRKKKVQPPKVHLETYCVMQKHPVGIASRLSIYLDTVEDAEREKTVEDWDAVYEKAMNRVTQ